MELPNRDNAIVPEAKVTRYLLNLEHPKGRGKAKFFIKFGFSLDEWEQLSNVLLSHVREHQVTKVEETKFGTRYVIEGEITTPVDRKPSIRSVWFILTDSTQPHLVTAYPLEESDD